MKVLIAAPVHPVLTDGLTAMGYECVVHENITQSTAFGLIGNCMGVITSTRLQLNRELIDAAPALKWIGRMGSGMEVVDTGYAAQKGISCFASPGGNCNAVGEHALGMLLALLRKITWSNNELLKGIWKRDENRGLELEGKTVGIIGYGYTGQAFAKKLQGFDVRILVYDKYHPDGVHPHLTKCNDLEPLFEEADIVSFHVPQQEDTIHYLDESFIARMNRPFILVNTSRGTVVDSMALKKALTSGKIAGACLDVFEHEPLFPANDDIRLALREIITFPNVIATPHIAGYTHEALYKMSRILLDKVAEWTNAE
jgi:D-3-phosphoglycerate dehydrogenase / 2-oxoglutarate reductase